jgi:hypothetical protein
MNNKKKAESVFLSAFFSSFGFAEGAHAWKNPNKFGFSPAYSYLCPQKPTKT